MTLFNLDVIETKLESGKTFPIPLNYVWSTIYSRPLISNVSMKYSDKAINWYHIMNPSENSLQVHYCQREWNPNNEDSTKFCVSVRRLDYPIDSFDKPSLSPVSESTTNWIQPAHVVTFISPVVLVNLLPYHLTLQIKNNQVPTVESIKPGKKAFFSVCIKISILLFSISRPSC